MSEQDGSTEQPSNEQSSTDMPPGGPLPIPSLNDIKLNLFSLTPPAIKGGETVTVKWSATVPPTLGYVTFQLNGFTVRGSGSEAFRPVVNTMYSLSAHRFGAVRRLASQVVTVDAGPCTLAGPRKPVVDLEFFIQAGIFDTFRVEKGYAIETFGATIRVVEQAFTDTTFVLEPDSGLLRLTIPLTATIDHIEGEGSLTARIWFRLIAQGGFVVPMVEKTETDTSLPWGIWLAALLALLGPGGFSAAVAFVAALNALAPQLASGEIVSSLGPITALITQPFGDRVSSVTASLQPRNPGDEPEPFISTTVCP